MSIRLLAGDCRDVLATLPANSVQCCVTSPPYYGLRDYGTATWSGGDAGCDHVAGNARNDVTPERLAARAALYGTGSGAGSKVAAMQFHDTCGKCGARRIDAQLGLEATPDCGKRGLFRLRSDLTEAQREFVVRRLLGLERRDV